jgi:uncharacterized membrane protein
VDLGQILVALAVALFAAIPLGLSIWAVLDAARRPQWAWALSGRRQVVWLAAVAFSAFTVLGGVVLAAWYLVRIRPEVAAAEEGRIQRMPPPPPR